MTPHIPWNFLQYEIFFRTIEGEHSFCMRLSLFHDKKLVLEIMVPPKRSSIESLVMRSITREKFFLLPRSFVTNEMQKPVPEGFKFLSSDWIAHEDAK